MAVLTLTRVFVNLLATGAAVSAQSGIQRARSHDVAGQVRTYASGRQRAVSTAGERGVFTFAMVDVSLATVEILRGWVNQAVQVRDARGQRFFGVFFGVVVGEARDATLYNVAIDLRVVTTAEGV
jgi:hypothetical protein